MGLIESLVWKNKQPKVMWTNDEAEFVLSFLIRVALGLVKKFPNLVRFLSFVKAINKP